MANIAVIGLGYVGATTAACLADLGHRIYGVDISREKVNLVSRGVPPVREPGLEECLSQGVAAGRVSATVAIEDALNEVDFAIVCVGTPTSSDGGVDLAAVERVALQIGAVIPERDDVLHIVIRSTVPPGSCDEKIAPAVAKSSGLAEGTGWTLVHNPEFLREGVAMADFFDPEIVVLGGDASATDLVGETLYKELGAPIFTLSRRESELVKYGANAFHAAKVSFANEIARLGRAYGIDGRKVMDILVQDTRLNVSAKYLRPAFAYGGSCLPKDLRGLLWMGKRRGVPMPLLAGVEESNRAILEQTIEDIRALAPQSVGLVGLAFKGDTDDLRESPFVELARRLIAEGIEVRIHDPNVDPERMNGANRTIADEMLPGWEEMLVSDVSAFTGVDGVILGRPSDEEQIRTWLDRGVAVIDLDGSVDVGDHDTYIGTGW